ncbi:hypothetical protein FJZ31_10505 [Candidatus Poribacteria bacterium]|nr:hypothetical protein [Candidatus Poribacteria bacterium]
MTIPTPQQIATLPRWACVALAAHCARQMYDISFSSLFAPEYKNIVDEAIKLAENAAAHACPPDGKTAAQLIDATCEVADAVFDIRPDDSTVAFWEFRQKQEAVAYTSEAACFAVMATEYKEVAAHYAEKAVERFKLFLNTLEYLPKRLPGVRRLFETVEKYNMNDDSPVSFYVFYP